MAYLTDYSGATATGNLAAANADNYVQTPCLGVAWATARITVSGTCNVVLTPEISLDGGFNWIGSAYVKRLDVVSANPAVSATITANAGTYELPLPANCTNVRARCTTFTSGIAAVTVGGGLPYVPGVPVTAVLYDVVTAQPAAVAQTFDSSGWTTAQVALTSSLGGGALSVNTVDDTGAIGIGNPSSIGASTAGVVYRTDMGGIPESVFTAQIGATFYAGGGGLPRRFQISMASVASGNNRGRVEVRR